MKLVNIKAFNDLYKGYILIENLKDLESYYKKYRKPQVHRACDDIMDRENFSSNLAAWGEIIVKIKTGDSYANKGTSINAIANLVGTAYSHQIEYLLKGKKLAINIKGGYFPIPDDAIIEDYYKPEHRIFKRSSLFSLFAPKEIK